KSSRCRISTEDCSPGVKSRSLSCLFPPVLCLYLCHNAKVVGDDRLAAAGKDHPGRAHGKRLSRPDIIDPHPLTPAVPPAVDGARDGDAVVLLLCQLPGILPPKGFHHSISFPRHIRRTVEISQQKYCRFSDRKRVVTVRSPIIDLTGTQSRWKYRFPG